MAATDANYISGTAAAGASDPGPGPGPGSGSTYANANVNANGSTTAAANQQHQRRSSRVSTTATRSSRKSRSAPRWWKIHLFRGMINDLRRRAPYYWSDWIDAWDYRVVPATVYMYFAK